jgi:hypothetical protein
MNINIPRLLGSLELLYRGSTSTYYVTRTDKMRQGYVARAFHLPRDVDDQLRMMAIKNHIRFSDEAILAFREHIAKDGGKK